MWIQLREKNITSIEEYKQNVQDNIKLNGEGICTNKRLIGLRLK